MKENMCELSIIVPVYNVEQYVEECILSITKEMTEADELILINDGSKDNSLEICKKYESSTVHIIDNTNHGVSYSRNCGISAATGKYIMFVDSDDYLFYGWREAVMKGMKTNSDVVYFSRSGIKEKSKDEIITNILAIPTDNHLDIRGGSCIGKLFNTDFVKNKKIVFDSEIINGEDGIFSLMCFLNSQTFAIVMAEPFYFYRLNNSSATHSFNHGFNTSNLKYIKTVDNALKASNIIESTVVKEYIDYITFNSLFILAYRISFVDIASERNKLYEYFKTLEYQEFYSRFENKWRYQKFKTNVYNLIKSEKYEAAIRKIRMRRKISAVIKKFRRKQNGFR